MSEATITKRCCTCKEVKSVSEFSKYRSRADGLQAQCKECASVYMKTYNKTYHQSEKWQVATEQYEKSDKGKAAREHYRQSGKRRTTEKNRHKQNPENRKARTAVRYAVVTGRLSPANIFKCLCGKQAIEYHHHKGYARKHWFNVIPICRSCHLKLR